MTSEKFGDTPSFESGGRWPTVVASLVLVRHSLPYGSGCCQGGSASG